MTAVSNATTSSSPLRVGIGGLGAIGFTVARRLDEGIPGMALAALSAKNQAQARARVSSFRSRPHLVPPELLPEYTDVVVECAPPAVFRRFAEPALTAGRVFMPLSVGQLLCCRDLIELAAQHGARILVPTGALLGLDAVRAAAEGEVQSVRLVTRKPPASLVGAPYIETNGAMLHGLTQPIRVFEGSASEAAKGFPANINVAAALALAGIGPERTRVEIWADPTLERNVHTVRVESDAARFEMTIEGLPSPENPRSSRMAALSVVAALRSLTSTLRVGS